MYSGDDEDEAVKTMYDY